MTYVGLCASCISARVVESRRGSQFWLCSRSAIDPRYPKYPRLPVLRCAGYEVRGDAEPGQPAGSGDGSPR